MLYREMTGVYFSNRMKRTNRATKCGLLHLKIGGTCNTWALLRFKCVLDRASL